MAADFTRTLSFSPTFDSAAKEKWSPPCFGMWKVNWDASYKDGVAALGMVIRDDCGTLIEATTKLISCYSAYEAEVKVVEWATSMTAIGERNNLIFISCAAKVVEEINSNTELKGWHTVFTTFMHASSTISGRLFGIEDRLIVWHMLLSSCLSQVTALFLFLLLIWTVSLRPYIIFMLQRL